MATGHSADIDVKTRGAKRANEFEKHVLSSLYRLKVFTYVIRITCFNND